MDAPIASLAEKWFCEGYENQAKKDEEEAEEIVDGINYEALKALCTRYDNKIGEYPEHEHEGAAVLDFFERLRDHCRKKEVKK